MMRHRGVLSQSNLERFSTRTLTMSDSRDSIKAADSAKAAPAARRSKAAGAQKKGRAKKVAAARVARSVFSLDDFVQQMTANRAMLWGRTVRMGAWKPGSVVRFTQREVSLDTVRYNEMYGKSASFQVRFSEDTAEQRRAIDEAMFAAASTLAPRGGEPFGSVQFLEMDVVSKYEDQEPGVFKVVLDGQTKQLTASKIAALLAADLNWAAAWQFEIKAVPRFRVISRGDRQGLLTVSWNVIEAKLEVPAMCKEDVEAVLGGKPKKAGKAVAKKPKAEPVEASDDEDEEISDEQIEEAMAAAEEAQGEEDE